MRRGIFIVVMVTALLFSAGTKAMENDIALRGFGGHVSLVKPEDIDWTFGLGGQVDLGTVFMPELHLVPSLSFWWKSTSDVVHGTKYESKFTEISINGDLQYHVGVSGGSSVQPYFGGGLGLIISRDSGEVSGYGDTSDSDIDLGISFFGGLFFAIGESSKGFVEGRFKIDGANTFMITTGFSLPTG